ncbi:hypothetical protein D9M70_500660 [compost metagenome]
MTPPRQALMQLHEGRNRRQCSQGRYPLRIAQFLHHRSCRDWHQGGPSCGNGQRLALQGALDVIPRQCPNREFAALGDCHSLGQIGRDDFFVVLPAIHKDSNRQIIRPIVRPKYEVRLARNHNPIAMAQAHLQFNLPTTSTGLKLIASLALEQQLAELELETGMLTAQRFDKALLEHAVHKMVDWLHISQMRYRLERALVLYHFSQQLLRSAT